MKNKTYNKFIGLFAIGVFVVAAGWGLTACVSHLVDPPSDTQFRGIKIFESGYLNGNELRIFQDVKTGQRIMYYRGAMVVLPSEKPELQ